MKLSVSWENGNEQGRRAMRETALVDWGHPLRGRYTRTDLKDEEVSQEASSGTSIPSRGNGTSEARRWEGQERVLRAASRGRGGGTRPCRALKATARSWDIIPEIQTFQNTRASWSYLCFQNITRAAVQRKRSEWRGHCSCPKQEMVVAWPSLMATDTGLVMR